MRQGRDLANKLWNASRLILLRVSDVPPDAGAATTVEDRWIVSRLERHTERVTELLDGFRFSHAALDLYTAFWSELCDWYLELAKPRLYEDDNSQVSAVLLWALERTLRLLHPVMPFVTEEIWSLMPGEERGLLAVADWPVADPARFDDAAEADVGAADPGGELAAPLPRRGRRACRGRRARAAPGRRLRQRPRPDRPARALRMGRARRFEWRRARHRADPRRRGAGAPLRCLRRRGGARPRREAAPAPARRGRARPAQARRTRTSWRRRRPHVVDEERRKLDEYREALRRLEGP